MQLRHLSGSPPAHRRVAQPARPRPDQQARRGGFAVRADVRSARQSPVVPTSRDPAHRHPGRRAAQRPLPPAGWERAEPDARSHDAAGLLRTRGPPWHDLGPRPSLTEAGRPGPASPSTASGRHGLQPRQLHHRHRSATASPAMMPVRPRPDLRWHRRAVGRWRRRSATASSVAQAPRHARRRHPHPPRRRPRPAHRRRSAGTCSGDDDRMRRCAPPHRGPRRRRRRPADPRARSTTTIRCRSRRPARRRPARSPSGRCDRRPSPRS